MKRISTLPLSSSCLFVALISMLLLAQSSRAPVVNQTNGLPIAQEPSPGTPPMAGAARPSPNTSSTGLSSLPPDAQGPISGALGKDDSRYWAHANASGFRAENPHHALVVNFTKQGAEVRSQNMGWRLETRGYGYGDAVLPVSAAAPHATANRVEYRRGAVTEWYVNGPMGLEQGFTLAQPPGKANGRPLTVALALSGDLVAALEPAGLDKTGLDKKSKALTLTGEDGQAALRYTGLNARDAMGRELRSWLELRGERLLLRVEDSGARYPLVVDPWIQQAELTASDGAAVDQFGISVAVDGSTAVVGAYGRSSYQGAAYVFVQSGTTWSQQAELIASDGAAGDQFGVSVAVSGGTAVVGAWNRSVGSNQGQGAAYVFVQSGTTWSQQAELIASDGAAYDYFGWSVAVSGSTAVVGAIGGNGSQGAAYVFVQSGTTWSQQAELTSSGGGGSFGISVAVSGSTAVVGAPGGGSGAAFVFVQSGGAWSEQAELGASDGAAGDWFGRSVAVNGNTAVVGAPLHTVGSNADQGAAYVFVQSGTTWSQQAELTSSDGAEYDLFGISVAVDESTSTAVVGAYGHRLGGNGGNSWEGEAYVFVQSGTTWSQQAELVASDEAAADEFGYSVAVSGNTAVVGAPGHHALYGAAYVFPWAAVGATPGGLFFGGQALNSTSAAQTATLTNDSTASLAISGISISGEFAISANTCGAALPAGENCTVNVTFTPTTLGAQAGTLSFIDDDPSSPQTVALSGTGIGTTVTPSPTSLRFGSEALNDTSAAKKVTFTNTGTATLDITGITTNGDFAISENTCGATLAVKKRCIVSVTFTPTVLGALTGTLSVSGNIPNSPQTVALSGTGIGTTITPSPTSLSFGNVVINELNASADKTVTLTNTGTVTLDIASITTSGDFTIIYTCVGTLAVNKECRVTLTFTPTVLGPLTGTLTFTDNAPNSPQTVALSGTGVEPATLKPVSYTFAKTTVGATSKARRFTLANNQNVTPIGIAISTTGDFAVSSTTCTTNLGAREKCTIDVTFTPTQTGALTGQLSVSDSASNSPQTSNLTGTGK